MRGAEIMIRFFLDHVPDHQKISMVSDPASIERDHNGRGGSEAPRELRGLVIQGNTPCCRTCTW